MPGGFGGNSGNQQNLSEQSSVHSSVNGSTDVIENLTTNEKSEEKPKEKSMEIMEINTTEENVEKNEDHPKHNVMTIPSTEDEILEWLSSPAVWESEPIDDPDKRNFECADATILRYEKLKDKTYGIWKKEYETCGNAKKGEVYFLSLGLKEAPEGNDDWQLVSYNATRGIYVFRNNHTGVEFMYVVSSWPENYPGKYDDEDGLKSYFANTICRLPECSSGELTRGNVKKLKINGYDAYLLHNSDWSGVEVAFFATPCQDGRCHEYGMTYIYLSLRGDRENVLKTLYSITHNLLIKPAK